MSLLLHLRFLFLLFQWPAAHRALHSFPTRRSSDLAVVTRVRRGDLELLARDDLVLEPGDRLAVVVDRRELDAVHAFLGDSDRKAGELDVLSLGLGLVLGFALGLVTLPMPGGGSFSLGPAAGPLLVGMILGALRRTGPVVWALPGSANLTLRQLGLLDRKSVV